MATHRPRTIVRRRRLRTPALPLRLGRPAIREVAIRDPVTRCWPPPSSLPPHARLPPCSTRLNVAPFARPHHVSRSTERPPTAVGLWRPPNDRPWPEFPVEHWLRGIDRGTVTGGRRDPRRDYDPPPRPEQASIDRRLARHGPGPGD